MRHGGWRSTTPDISRPSPSRPDLGERYLDTIYQTNWLADVYGEDVLTPNQLITDAQAA